MALHDHPVDPARVAAARARLIDTEEAGRLAGLLGLLADPTRARILYALDLVDELCVGDLADADADDGRWTTTAPSAARLVTTLGA